jgi:hypothetical protein
MNVEIGTEAARFPEKENVNGIFVAVCRAKCGPPDRSVHVYGQGRWDKLCAPAMLKQ